MLLLSAHQFLACLLESQLESVVCIFLNIIFVGYLASRRALLFVSHSRRTLWSVVIADRMRFDCSAGWSRQLGDGDWGHAHWRGTTHASVVIVCK